MITPRTIDLDAPVGEPTQKRVVTKHELVTALLTGGPLARLFKIVNAVEREDGSNRSYNVSGYSPAGASLTVHVRTLD